MNKMYDFFMPRFVTEECAFFETEHAYEPVCSMSDEPRDHEYTHIGTISGFNLFGVMLFPRLKSFRSKNAV